MAEDKLTMFGKTYNTVGSADSNLILQTRGDLKVRWGNKFIDLIKNGKIAVDVEFLKKVDSKDSISSDGIYLVKNEESDEIWICIKGQLYNLYGEIGTDYVSFVKAQETTVEQKYQALQNIGLCYDTFQNAYNAKIQQGIIYCEDTKKLYTIKDGLMTEYVVDISWPNLVNIGEITIDGENNTISSGGNIHISSNNSRYISIADGGIGLLFPVTFNKAFQSYDFTEETGFAITEEGGKYTLSIDNIDLRGQINGFNTEELTYMQLYKRYIEGLLKKDTYYIISDFQNEWEVTSSENTLKEVQTVTDSSNNITRGKDRNVRPLKVKAISSTELDKIAHFVENPEWDVEYDITFYHNIVKTIDEKQTITKTKGRITKLTDENNNTANFDFKHKTFKIQEDQNLDNIEEDEEYCYLFSQNNPEYYRTASEIRLFFLSKHYHKYRDASSYDASIKNNIIIMPEPQVDEHDTVSLPTDFVVFFSNAHDNNCRFSGHYVFNNEFNNNYILNIQNSTISNNGKINNCNFTGNSVEVTINGNIQDSSFKDISNVYLLEDIKECSFNALQGDSRPLILQGPLNNVIIDETLTLVENIPDHAESLLDTSVLSSIANFSIDADMIPRLACRGTKHCSIKDVMYQGDTCKVFSVDLSYADTAPPGIIVMYNGSNDGIPDGWVLCDGSNNTPDLRGALGAYSVSFIMKIR